MAKKKQTVNTVKTSKPYADIFTFLDTAENYFGLTSGQVEGFKAFMQGKYYQHAEQDFIPYLEQYLGKKLK